MVARRVGSLWWVCWLALGLCLMCGCEVPPLPNQGQIQHLRVLGIKSTPPSARPGTSIELTALVASPYIKPVTYQWYACASTGDVNVGCQDKANATLLGEGAKVTYEIPKDYLPDKPSPELLFRGKYLPITLVAKAGPHQEVATKRVVVSPLPMNNKNPSITELQLFQGQQDAALAAPWQVSAGVTCTLKPFLDMSMRESYLTLDTSGKLHTVDEVFQLTWFITEGSLSGGRSSQEKAPNKTWKMPQAVPPLNQGKVNVYLVVRDGRGGIDWLEKAIQLR